MSLLDRFRRYLSQREEGASPTPVDADDLPACVPDDLNAIAEAGDGEIALIQADGNSLGKTVQELVSLAQYRSLSEQVGEAVETALFETLAQHGPRGGTLPWEVLFLGGDDILLATADDIALTVVTSLVRRIEDRTEAIFSKPPLDAIGRSHLSFGAGVVIADPHVPIAVLRELSHQLERSAKRRTYARLNEDPDAEISTLDIHRITGSGSASLDHIRSYALQPRRVGGFDAVRLTRRPFTLGEVEEVIRVAQAWSESSIPTSKLHALRESLFVSPAEAMRQWTHVVGRASPKHRTAWMQLYDLLDQDNASGDYSRPPFMAHRSTGHHEDASYPAITTPLLDVIDLYDLV
jgi:hypothetical protein